jgi:hypothetical protein
MADREVQPVDVLSPVERDISQVLSEHGGIMARSQLQSICLGMGMNQFTFRQCLFNSPIIARHAIGLYGLIGSAAR